jgi:acyl-CoA synthetase (AMP-forming)/AMP-acid ligase II
MMPFPCTHDLLDDAAARYPDRPAVSSGSEVLSYAAVRTVSLRLASYLIRCGVGRGDRVVIALPPGVLLPPLLYACSRIGAVFVVIGDHSPAPVCAHVLADCAPVLILTDAAGLRNQAGRTGLPRRGLADLRTAAADPSPPEPPGRPVSADPVCFIYTSGSTALPKAVVSTQLQVTFAVHAIQDQLGYEPGDKVYCALPLSFDYGLYQVFLSTLAGAELYLAPGEAGGQGLLADLRSSQASVLPAVPPLARNLALLLTRPGAVPPALRLLTNTGAAMPATVLADLRRRLPGLRVQLMYGLTECKRATIMAADEDLRRPGSCGRALPGTDVFTVDAAGVRLLAGETGEIVVRGPNVMAGYWRRPDLTAQRFRRADGLFPELHTGDYGWLDEDGYLYFAGRRDDLYKERGYRVSATEIEAAAHRVPGVRVAVVLPPLTAGEGATLLVESNLSGPEVLSRLRDELDESKVPSRCVIVPKVPINGHGKVDRGALVRMAEGAGD